MYCKVAGCRYPQSHITTGHLCGICKTKGHGQVECNNINEKNKLNQYKFDKFPKSLWCTFEFCNDYNTHTNDAHHCMYKNCISKHSISKCPNIINVETLHKIKCPLCRVDNQVKSTQPKILGLDAECAVCCDNNVEMFLPNCGHCCLCYICFLTMTDNNFDISASKLKEIEYKFGSNDGKVYTEVYGGMGCTIFAKRDSKDTPIMGYFQHSDSWGQYGPTTDDRPKLFRFINGYVKV